MTPGRRGSAPELDPFRGKVLSRSPTREVPPTLAASTPVSPERTPRRPEIPEPSLPGDPFARRGLGRSPPPQGATGILPSLPIVQLPKGQSPPPGYIKVLELPKGVEPPEGYVRVRPERLRPAPKPAPLKGQEETATTKRKTIVKKVNTKPPAPKPAVKSRLLGFLDKNPKKK